LKYSKQEKINVETYWRLQSHQDVGAPGMLVSASRRLQSHQNPSGARIIYHTPEHTPPGTATFLVLSFREIDSHPLYSPTNISKRRAAPRCAPASSLQCPKASANQRAAKAAEAETSLFQKCARPFLLAQKGIDPRCSRPPPGKQVPTVRLASFQHSSPHLCNATSFLLHGL
jgi:hypothetical protein